MKTWYQVMPLSPPRVPDGSSIPRTEEPPPAGPWSSSCAHVLPQEAEPEEPGETSSMHEDSDTEPADSTDGSETPEALGSHGPAGTESDEEFFLRWNDPEGSDEPKGAGHDLSGMRSLQKKGDGRAAY